MNQPGFCFVVLGMHRCGTSALAGVLSFLGFQAGKTLLPATRFNERGYFEDSVLVQQHDALLKSLGYAWYDERPFPVDWQKGKEAAEAKTALTGQLQAEYDLEQPCVIKDPRMCRLLPLWKDIFAELGIVPGYILSVRDPIEVAESLMRRDGLPANRVALLYAAHVLEAERETRGLPRVVVEYGSLLKDWQKVVRSIEAGLGICLPPIGETHTSSVESFLSPDLKHCSGVQALREASSPEAVRALVSSIAGGDRHDEGEAGSACPRRAKGLGQSFADTPMRIAQAVYQLLSGAMDGPALEALDELRVDLDRCLSSLDPWLSNAAEVKRLREEFEQLRQELLQPRERTDRAAEAGAKSVLYWRTTDEEYSESQSVRRPWHFGIGPETLCFVLPPRVMRIDSLRWDITDRPAFCEVSDAWIKNPRGDRVWQWQVGMPLFSQASGDMKVIESMDKRSRLWVVSLGFDPRAQVNIPSYVVSQMAEGWAFGAVFSARLTTKALPQLLTLLENRSRVHQETPGFLQKAGKWRWTRPGATMSKLRLSAELEEMVALLSQRIVSRDQTIAAQHIRLQELHGRQSQSTDELLRAESQLDFLKYLLLNEIEVDRL